MTPDRSGPVHCTVLRMGTAAARILSRTAEGRVTAAFRHSFYCEFNGSHVCIGPAALGMCPLNLATTLAGDGISALSGIKPDLPVRMVKNSLKIGESLFLRGVNETRVWRPPPPRKPRPEIIKRGLKILEDTAIPRLPEDGLSRFINAGANLNLKQKLVLKQAARPLQDLQSWLRKAFAEPENIPEADTSSWQELLGLGPGLTPSGDDLIGGVMLSLYALKEIPALNAFSSAAAPLLATRTNPISAAHLREAMNGAGTEVAHAALNAIFAGDRGKMGQALADIEKYGHTSGWDILAGIVIAVRCWLECSASCQAAS